MEYARCCFVVGFRYSKVGGLSMSKAIEEYIKKYTRHCSNEVEMHGLGNQFEPWLKPYHAECVAQIAREETLLEVAKWIKDTFIFSKQAKEDFSQTFNVMKELL